MQNEIYLDWAATSYKKPEKVVLAVTDFFNNVGVSSGRGAYKRAFDADRIVFECRKEAAKLFNVDDPANIVLSSGATESINLVLKGYLKSGDHVVTTSLEHNAVIRTLHRLQEEKDITYTIVKCDPRGYFNLTDFEKAINKKTRLFAINHASNVIGTILPISDISNIASAHDIRVLIDAAQSAGAIDVDAKAIGADFIAFAGHKSLLGPQGTGGLYIKSGVELSTLKEGGTGSDSKSLTMPNNLPERFEAGTQNYPGFAGLKEGIKHINTLTIDKIRNDELEIIKYAHDELATIAGLTLYGTDNHEDKVGVFTFNIAGHEPSMLASTLDREYNIMVRAGLHCAPLAHESVGTIDRGAVRMSIGHITTKDEIDALTEALKDIIK
ncbi:aminotransferase class V-fold PLP-dependent enzyme [Thermodesulfobacteriota bacterium]